MRVRTWGERTRRAGGATHRTWRFGPARRLVVEEHGAETVETALVLLLISLAVVVGVAATGNAASNLWTSVDEMLAAVNWP